MAEAQLYGQYVQQAEQQQQQQQSVSYLTNPAYNPTVVIHHHHGTALNVILMAATGTLVSFLFLFLAGVGFYLIRRRRRQKRAKPEKASDKSSTAGQTELSRSMLDSEQDMSSFRHSKATCDSCSTRVRTTRLPTSYSPTPQRQSRLSRASPYHYNDSHQQEIEDQSNHHRLSIRFQQQPQLHTPLLESALAERFEIKSCEYKGKFDWDRCDFELQEEEAMWLPNRSLSFKSRQRGMMMSHSRSCSESATRSPPPKALLLPALSKSRSRVTWTDSALSIEAQDDYFVGQRTGESSFTGVSPGVSPGQSTANTLVGTSEHSPLVPPASPYVIHTPSRQSYSARVASHNWDHYTDAVENLDMEAYHHQGHTPKSPCASMNSLATDGTAFSDPFGGSKVDLNSDFVVLSRPAHARSEHYIPSSPIQTKKELSLHSATSPLISSPLKMKNGFAADEDAFFEPLANQVVRSRKSEHFDREQESRGQRGRSATIGLGEVYPIDTPLRTHRFDRRDAVVAANIPVSPTVTDFASQR